MKSIYIVKKHLLPSIIGYCSFWHGTELPSGEILVSAQFAHDYGKREFESHPSVELVGAEYDGSPIDDAHVDKLAHLGVKRGHTAKNVRALAQSANHLM